MAWIDQLFQKMVEMEASDLHMSSTVTPMFRIHGEMGMISGYDPIPPDQMMEYLKEIAPERNIKEFEHRGHLCLSRWTPESFRNIENDVRPK